MNPTNYNHIQLQTDHRNVAWLTLNRESKHNAMSVRMMDELQSACAQLNADPTIRAVVITGAGERSFSAGADLDWMKSNFQKGRKERVVESARLVHTLQAIDTLNKVTIARVNGQAYAGGVGIISVCDIAIAVNNARFSMTETRLGLTPANISPYVIRRVGESNARRILLNAHFFQAGEALSLGLLHRVVEAHALDEAVESEIKSCLACAPGAIAMTKTLIRQVSRMSLEESRDYTAEMLADAWEGDEARAGVSGFFDGQSPPWASESDSDNK